MVSTKDVTRLDHSSVKLTVTIEKAEVRKAYESILDEFRKNAQLKGFRKGHTPLSILEQKYGPEIQSNAMSDIIEKSLEEVFKDIPEQPLPYAQPRMDEAPAFSLDADLVYTVIYDVFPQVTMGDWKGLTVSVPKVKIDMEDEERELGEIRERNAVVIEKDDGKGAEKDDIVTVNYAEIDEKGAEVAGTARQDFVFAIGSGYDIYKFDDDIVGMKKDEEKTIVKDYPADFADKDLAGKKKTLKVKITKIKIKQLPELNDDLAQDVSEKYKTLDDLRADIRKRLEENLEAKIRELKIKAVLDQLVESSTIDLPESMVALEMENRFSQFAKQFGADAERMVKIIESSGKTKQDLFSEWREPVEKALKSQLIVTKLLETEKVEASDADIEEEIKKISERSSMSVDEVKAQYEKEHALHYLKEELEERRLFDTIFAAGTVKQGDKAKYVDLFKENE